MDWWMEWEKESGQKKSGGSNDDGKKGLEILVVKNVHSNIMLVVVYATEKVFLMISLCIFLPSLLTKDKFWKNIV